MYTSTQNIRVALQATINSRRKNLTDAGPVNTAQCQQPGGCCNVPVVLKLVDHHLECNTLCDRTSYKCHKEYAGDKVLRMTHTMI